MPTDICEQLRKRAMYVPFVFEAKDGNLDREAADTIESLRAEVSRLSAELEGARKALEPFAKAAKGFDRIPKQVGGKRALGVSDDFHILSNLTVGDLRRARDQFKEPSDGQ